MYLSAQKIIDYCEAILSNSESNVEDIMETDPGDAITETSQQQQHHHSEKSGFIVVECKRIINQTNNRVCIPKAWISHEIRGEKVAFGYPAEDEDSIAMRIKDKEPADETWPPYIGEVKFEAESYEDAVGYLQPICGKSSEQIEDNSNEKSYDDAVGYLQPICGENSKQIENNSNQKSYEDVVGYLQNIFGESSEQIEDTSYHKSNEDGEEAVGYLQTNCGETSAQNGDTRNTNTKSCEDVVGNLQTILGDNSKQIEDNSNLKSHGDAVVYLQTLCGESSKQIEDNSNQKSFEDGCSKQLMLSNPQTICGENSKHIEEKTHAIAPVTEPKNPLKLRIVLSKLDQKPEKKKKSEKKDHKKHLKEHPKDKVHESKHTYMEQLSLIHNTTERSSTNSVDTQEGTKSYVSCESDYQSSKSSPKSQESEISKSVPSVPKTRLKNDNNNSYSSKRILLNSLDAEKENNNDVLSEDRQSVDNMYKKIMRHVQYMETIAMENKKSQLIAMEHMKIVDKLAAKYGIPLNSKDSVVREKKRKTNPFTEENLQDDAIENQEDYFIPSSKEVIQYKGKLYPISKENDIRTLKHPRLRKGLIPIGRNSRIYISAKGLKTAKRTCRNVKEFARRLYREGFTPKALRTCSMNGVTRPALHYEARTILKNYALKYGQHVGWESIEAKELEDTLSTFLNNNNTNSLRKRKTQMERK